MLAKMLPKFAFVEHSQSVSIKPIVKSEVGIYKRKQESKKKRKHDFN